MHILINLSLALLLAFFPITNFATPVAYSSEIATFSSATIPQEEEGTLATTKDFPNRVLLIRHGEKPSKGSDDETGLSKEGRQRAQCLRKYMGTGGRHNIGLIMAESYNPRSGMRMRPFLTVKPLAKDLGLDVDTSCERDDPACVHRVIKEFAKSSTKDVLICWKHSELAGIAQELGARVRYPYPDNRFDLVWFLKHKKIQNKESEKCKGIDDGRLSKHDPDLEIDNNFDKESSSGEEIVDVKDYLSEMAWDSSSQFSLRSSTD